jgi:hypothetical protein
MVDREQHHRGGPDSRPAGRGGPGPGTRRQAPGWPGCHRPSRPPASLARLDMPARQGGGITRPGHGHRRHRRTAAGTTAGPTAPAAAAGSGGPGCGCGVAAGWGARRRGGDRGAGCGVRRQPACNRGAGGLPAGTRLRPVHARLRRPGFPGPQSDGTTTRRNRGTFFGGARAQPGNRACAHPGGAGDDCGAAAAGSQPAGEARRVHARARGAVLPRPPGCGGRAPASPSSRPASMSIRRGSRPRSPTAGRCCTRGLCTVGREPDRFCEPSPARSGPDSARVRGSSGRAQPLPPTVRTKA